MKQVGYRCVKNASQECSGCMSCQPEKHYYCPICGGEVFETVFVDNNKEVIGCENCAKIKEPYEVLDDETD